MPKVRKKRVVIDARVIPGKGGGVETLIRGLAVGLASASESDLEFVFLVTPGYSELISEHNRNSRLVILEENSSFIEKRDQPKFLLKLKHRLKTLIKVLTYVFKLPINPRFYFGRDQFLDNLNADVLHLPFQTTINSNIPYIFHPHDLQHKHLPKLFKPKTRLMRDANYSLMCRNAALVSVASNWVRDDLMRFYKVPSSKIFVTPLAPLAEPNNLNFVDGRSLNEIPPQDFLLYPAVNWPHKNHRNLLLAIRQLKDCGRDLRIVLTGKNIQGQQLPSQFAREIGIEDRVIHLGHVSRELLELLYVHARGVIVPTKFEAASFPVYEAQKFGKAVACSRVTSLPEQVGDSAVLFDPNNISEIAESMWSLWTEDSLIVDLQRKSAQNVENISWEQTCGEFIKLYRYVMSADVAIENI